MVVDIFLSDSLPLFTTLFSKQLSKQAVNTKLTRIHDKKSVRLALKEKKGKIAPIYYRSFKNGVRKLFSDDEGFVQCGVGSKGFVLKGGINFFPVGAGIPI